MGGSGRQRPQPAGEAVPNLSLGLRFCDGWHTPRAAARPYRIVRSSQGRGRGVMMAAGRISGGTGMANVLDVAAYILRAKGPMSAMKLQKLCYYAYGYHLA